MSALRRKRKFDRRPSELQLCLYQLSILRILNVTPAFKRWKLKMEPDGRKLGDRLPFGAAIAADVLSALPYAVPGGASLAKIVDNYVERRRREAAQLLIEELSSGQRTGIQFDEHDVDPLIEIILCFSKAVDDGCAWDNLRLIAKVILGLKRNRALDGDNFSRWARVLESLSRDEIIALGTAYRLSDSLPVNTDEDKKAEYVDLFWKSFVSSLNEGGYDGDQVAPLCASLSRAGILIPVSAWGALIYKPSPWLFEIGELALSDPKHRE